ncbi:MAG: isoaspartyl peptidase/L-asparaginase family protein [Arenimonas sp.]
MRLPLAATTFLLALAMTTASNAAPPRPTALVIHAGAGIMSRDDVPADSRDAIRADLDRALDAGNKVLTDGGSALDAVGAAIQVLEDSPWFNAGKGAVFNAEGGHELDASIMEGHTRRAGAVAGVFTVRHPIALARAVMEHSEHVMFAGGGAEKFADLHPEIERVDPHWFDTDRRRKQLEDAQAEEKQAQVDHLPPHPGTYFGTVGAVALDQHGHIAAGTSTGGMTNKKWNRIGDSPIIGAGTYATDTCGVSGTGWGEYYIRAGAAHDICARVAYGKQSLADAAEEVINKVIVAMGGDGGAIALDNTGTIVMPFNTTGMYRGWVNPDGTRGTAIFADDSDVDGEATTPKPARATPAH